jgi:hypothetical protein
MKFSILFTIAIVGMIGIMIPSVYAQFTGMAEEPIAFESKYDWEKDYQYGSMGIFIEGDVILNAPYSGQQIVINIQKPNGAMNLYDIIQLDPSAHYGFFLRDASGYWPLGETKIELRNNLAHYTGVINIVDTISHKISETKENIIEQKIPTPFSGVESIYDSKRLWSIVQTCTGSSSVIQDTCDFRCGGSQINYSLKDQNGDVLSAGSFENTLKIPLKEYPEDTFITFSRDNVEDKELKLCELNIVKHGDTAPKFESYNYEETKSETKTNVDKIYTYAEIYAATDQAGLNCDNKHGPPFYSMDQQFAYNDCHNSVNTWELNQLDRTDYYGEPQRESSGGGCLIATATYGSEMSTEVQQLRELRDNQLLQTASGTAFMGTFNDVYYSFSPIIADYERENPLFKEAVKLAITPMISTLSLMENAETESEVLSIGISVIMLNLGMYLGIPAIVIVGIRKRF